MQYNDKNKIISYPFQFLALVQLGEKSFHNENDFNLFLNLDLNNFNTNCRLPIMEIISHHDTYNLSPEQIMKICEKSDINFTDSSQWTYLHYIFTNNKFKKLNLNNQQLTKLLDKTNLATISIWDKIYLHYLLACNQEQELGFTQHQLCEIYDKSIEAVENYNYKNKIYNAEKLKECINLRYPEFQKAYNIYKQKKQLMLLTETHTQTQSKHKL